MKRIISFLIIVLLLTSCVPRSRLALLGNQILNEEQLAYDTVNQLVELLEKKDSDGIRNLFSVYAQTNATDFDDGINLLIDYYEGNSIRIEDQLGSTSKSVNYGVKEITVNRDFLVETDTTKYIFSLVVKKYSHDDDQCGLFQLRVSEGEEDDYGILWILHDDTPGVLWGDSLTPKDYLAGATRALSNRILDTLFALYSTEIKNSLGELRMDLENVSSLFRGYADYYTFPSVTVLSTDLFQDKVLVRAECDLDTLNFDRTYNLHYYIYYKYFPYESQTNPGGLYSFQVFPSKEEGLENLEINKAGISYYGENQL
jgi:hypothetical protein